MNPQDSINPDLSKHHLSDNRDSFGTYAKLSSLVSEKDVDLHDTTGNFNFDVTANFGINTSQIENESPGKDFLNDNSRCPLSYTTKIKPFGENTADKFGTISSFNFIQQQNLSEVQQKTDETYFESRGGAMVDKIVVSLEFSQQNEIKPVSLKQSESSSFGNGLASMPEFISFTNTANRKHTESLANENQTDSQAEQFLKLSKIHPKSNFKLTISQELLEQKLSSSDPNNFSEQQGNSEVPKTTDEAYYESFGKEVHNKLSEIVLNPMADSNLYNDISFNNDYIQKGDKIPIRIEPILNFQKINIDNNFLASEQSVACLQPSVTPIETNLFSKIINSVSDLSLFKVASVQTNALGVPSSGQSFQTQSIFPESHQTLQKLVQAKALKKPVTIRNEMRELNAEMRNLEIEEKFISEKLKDLKFKEKSCLRQSQANTFKDIILKREKYRRFEHFSNKLENEKISENFGKIGFNSFFKSSSHNLTQKSIKSLVFLKQEEILGLISGGESKLQKIKNEIEKGNLYDLMNDIEVKLHRYDFESDDFTQMKTLYLQRLQLERELEVLKKKETEYDNLI